MQVHLNELPPHARAWLYVGSQPLQGAPLTQATALLDAFVQQWAAHGQPLRAAWQLLHPQLLVIAVDEDHAAPSGCSIDASVHVLRQMESLTGASWLDKGLVALAPHDQEPLTLLPLSGLKAAVAAGQLTPETRVANAALTHLAQVHNLWQPAGQTWLNRYFTHSVVPTGV